MACYKNLVIADAPLSYWRLGEPSGTTAADEMGASAGTYVNTPDLGVAGALGDGNTAITCKAGSAEYVTVAGLTAMPAQLSIEAWLKTTTQLSDNGLAGWGTGAVEAGIYIPNYLRIRFLVGATNLDYDPPGSFIDGAWHHIVVTHDGTNACVYLDGVLGSGPSAKTYTGGTNSTTFKIGQYGAPSGSDYDGSVDEVAIYNYALTSGQVAAHYAAAPNLCASPRSFGVLIA